MIVATRIRFPDGWTEKVLASVPDGVPPAPTMDARKVTILFYNPSEASRKACDIDFLSP